MTWSDAGGLAVVLTLFVPFLIYLYFRTAALGWRQGNQKCDEVFSPKRRAERNGKGE